MAFVYLIQAQIGVIKIGHANDPSQRLATVHTHSPVPVRLIAQWPGKVSEERELHRRFDQHRTHSEWFRLEGDLLDFVSEVQGRGVDRIVEWSEVTRAGFAERQSLRAHRHSIAMKARWADPEWRAERARTQEIYRQKKIADGERNV